MYKGQGLPRSPIFHKKTPGRFSQENKSHESQLFATAAHAIPYLRVGELHFY